MKDSLHEHIAYRCLTFINLKLSNLSINKLKKMNIDSEKLQLEIQRKLIEGNVNVLNNGSNID